MTPIWKDKKSDSEKTGFIPRPSSVPYLPLSNYEITSEATDLIPYEIAKKYSIVPVGRTGNIISIVMENPYDEEAVKVVEDFTGCVVRRFIGTHAEIKDAIASFVPRKEAAPKQADKPSKEAPAADREPHLIEEPQAAKEIVAATDSKWDGKSERRSAYRFRCSLVAHFPNKLVYAEGKTLDISYTGVAIISKNPIPIGTYLNVRIDLPEKDLTIPTALLVLVIRSPRIDSENFCIGGKIINVDGEDIKKIVRYFSSKHEANGPYKGFDKRKYARYKADIELWFPVNTSYVKASFQDISDCGFSIKTRTSIPVGTCLPIEIAPINDLIDHPIVWLAEVARASTTPDGHYDIGMKWASIHRNGNTMESIIKYAGKHPTK